jgi:hypothetical protein
LNGPDPGLVSGYETKADPDVEWAGAVATGAKVQLFGSNSTNSSSGIDLSALYSIDNY